MPWKLSLTTSSSAAGGSSKNDRSPTVAAGTLPPAALTSDVDPAEAVEHGRAGALELGCVEHVGLEHDRGFAEAARQRFERLAPSREEADPSARCGEAARDRAAERARRTGHDGDLVLETEELRQRGRHAAESVRPDRSTGVQLSVITDEIDARLGQALDVCAGARDPRG